MNFSLMKISDNEYKFLAICYMIFFLLTGGLCLVWNIIWFFCIFEDPTTDRFMTQSEKNYFKSFSFNRVEKVGFHLSIIFALENKFRTSSGGKTGSTLIFDTYQVVFKQFDFSHFSVPLLCMAHR